MFIDAIEPRVLLTITSATFNATTGVVAIVGDDGRDIIEAEPLGGGGVTVTSGDHEFNYPGPVKRIDIRTNGGGDLINCSLIVKIPCYIDGGAGPDFINSGAGNDTLIGGGGGDAIIGGRGNDSIDGGLQGDLLVGGIGDDTILAGSSVDTQDTITGGKGTDTVDFSHDKNGVFVKVGSIVAPKQSDLIYGDVNILIGSPFNDELVNGTKRGMLIQGGAGDDTLCGGSGPDTIVGGTGNNKMEGFGGNDIFDITAGAKDSVDGGSGTDTVMGATSNDTLINVP